MAAAALERADGDHPRAVLDYARGNSSIAGHLDSPTFSQALPAIHCGTSCTALTLIGQHPLFVHFQNPACGSAHDQV
jgi:hypothetical protein